MKFPLAQQGGERTEPHYIHLRWKNPVFYGIIIQMFWNDHAPPHFHLEYNEFNAAIDIRTLEVIEGKLPRSKLMLVRKWARKYKNELMENWELCRNEQSPKKIQPLP